MLRSVKSEIRILGWDDAPFTFEQKKTILVGVVCRGGTQVDGVMTTRIEVDGTDVTEKLIKAVNRTPHKDQIRVIMLDGITFGGFNVVDIGELHKKTKLPVVVVIQTNPDMASIRKSLERFPDRKKRLEKMRRAGKVKKLEIKNKVLKVRKTIYYQNLGIDDYSAESVIRMSAVNSSVPEPLRVAHMIGRGLGEMR